MRPALLTFDIFGTVLDWRRGLAESLRALNVELSDDVFDRIVDAQGREEQRAFRPYTDIVARSLIDVLGVPPEAAHRIGADAGRWPLFADSRESLRALLQLAPCAATTNSDRVHGAQVVEHLGFPLSGWICAEEVGKYKPDAAIWRAASSRCGVTFGPHWWHVSAYADYDLKTAGDLGLTRVFVQRPHSRPGPADHAVRDLGDLVRLVESA
jgi:2-haloalkanoic acid dehalogenase type II